MTHPLVDDLEEELQEAFNFKILEEQERPNRLYWSELIQKKAEGLKKNDDEDNVPKNIGKKNPISDFREMINYRNDDLFESAVK